MPAAMDESGLESALARVERALDRVERAIADKSTSRGRDDELRAKVRDALAELDDLIQMAEA